MNKYRFSGRIATFFRATDNAWASARTISATVSPTNRKGVRVELQNLLEYGHVERRGKPHSYEHRWNPDTLHAQAPGRQEVAHASE